MKDTRIVYGAHCAWWDSIDKVSKKEIIPTCPHCGSVLFEMPEDEWFAGVDKMAREKPHYRAQVEWSRGKCFENYLALNEAYNAEHPDAKV